MAIRNILFHAFEGDAGKAVEDVAFDLAEQHGATLTALSIIDNTPIPAYVTPYVPANLAETYIGEARDMAQAVEARVKAREKSTGIETEWRAREGDIRGVFAQHAHYTDLCVLAQGAGDDIPVGPALNLAGDMVLAAGRPILVVPWKGTSAPIGNRILVAWNGSKEAARAVHDALPLLEAADAVKVLTVGPETTGHIPGAEIATHLARHGVKVEADHAIERDMSTSESLAAEAADFAADMMVCGAWGHSRMLETVLGGVTRDLLHEVPVPLFLAH
ncbi:MAG: universal stress protein [Alphaproteobacteria bacterium]